MQPSYLIARLAGPLFVVIGVGMLINHGVYRQMIDQFLAAYPFVYLSGIVLLVAGLAILNFHNRWTRDWRSAITLLGWLVTIGGTFRILAPHLAVFLGSGTLSQDGVLTGVALVLLSFGGFLSFKGYSA